jgi:hypothetical protein
LLALVVLACGGCGPGGATRTETATVTVRETVTAAATGAVPGTFTRVTPYFLDGEQVAAGHPVETDSRAVAAVALRATLGEPTNGLTTAIPRGTRLLRLTIENGTATADLSHEFARGGGSLSMRARVAQVVYTLTRFPSVKRVRFAIDGRPVEAIGGEGVVVDPPVDRADFEDETPAILVETPGYGESVSSPIHVQGTANTFEATYQYELVDASGKVLQKDFGTATSGTGTRGTFAFTLRYGVIVPTRAELVVFEDSAANGERIHVRRIPLTLEP